MPHYVQYAALVILNRGRRVELSVPWDTGVWVHNELAHHRLGPLIVIHDNDGERHHYRTRPLFVLFYDEYLPSWQFAPLAWRFHDE